MRRAVFDSTVLISAFLRPGGLSDELITLAVDGRFTLVVAPEIVAETSRKLLTSTRLRARYRYPDERAHSFAEGLLLIAEVVRDLPSIAGIVRDPNDDMVIACAVKGRVERIVTRDKDILSIETYQGIAMSSPEEFRMLLRTDE